MKTKERTKIEEIIRKRKKSNARFALDVMENTY
jgi:hypothetical protein